MLNNVRNIEEAGELHTVEAPGLIEKLKSWKGSEAEDLFREVEDLILKPWKRIALRQPPTKSPHWNVKLDFSRKAMIKARITAINSGLDADYETFYTKRKEFKKEKRSQKRSFQRKAEARLRD